MRKRGESTMIATAVDNPYLEARHFYFSFARELINAKVPATCNHVVVSAGQFDLGWPEYRPTPTEEFQWDLVAGIGAIRNKTTSAQHIVVISSNYNPPGRSMLSCPPKDWRAPDLVDLYNSISRGVTAGMDNVEYLDLQQAVVGPVWDSAPDWCHPPAQAFQAQADRILMHFRRAANGI